MVFQMLGRARLLSCILVLLALVNLNLAAVPANDLQLIRDICTLNNAKDLWQGVTCSTYDPTTTSTVRACALTLDGSDNLVSIKDGPLCGYVDDMVMPTSISLGANLQSVYLSGNQPNLGSLSNSPNLQTFRLSNDNIGSPSPSLDLSTLLNVQIVNSHVTSLQNFSYTGNHVANVSFTGCTVIAPVNFYRTITTGAPLATQLFIVDSTVGTANYTIYITTIFTQNQNLPYLTAINSKISSLYISSQTNNGNDNDQLFTMASISYCNITSAQLLTTAVMTPRGIFHHLVDHSNISSLFTSSTSVSFIANSHMGAFSSVSRPDLYQATYLVFENCTFGSFDAIFGSSISITNATISGPLNFGTDVVSSVSRVSFEGQATFKGTDDITDSNFSSTVVVSNTAAASGSSSFTVRNGIFEGDMKTSGSFRLFNCEIKGSLDSSNGPLSVYIETTLIRGSWISRNATGYVASGQYDFTDPRANRAGATVLGDMDLTGCVLQTAEFHFLDIRGTFRAPLAQPAAMFILMDSLIGDFALPVPSAPQIRIQNVTGLAGKELATDPVWQAVYIMYTELTGPIPTKLPSTLTIMDLRYNKFQLCSGVPEMGPMIPTSIGALNVAIFPQDADVTCYCIAGNCLTGNAFPAYYQGTPAVFQSTQCIAGRPTGTTPCYLGFWTISSNFSISDSLQVEGAISVTGDFNVTSGGSLDFSYLGNPILVEGVATIDESVPITISVTDALVESILNSKTISTKSATVQTVEVPLVRGSGGIIATTSAQLSVQNGASCHTISAEPTRINQGSLTSLFTIDSSACSSGNGAKAPSKSSSVNTLGIVAISVAGGLLLIIIITILFVVFNRSCRSALRPFSVRG